MELAIFTIFVLLVIVVWQRVQFSRAINEKSDEIARMREINHAIAGKLWDKTTEIRSLKALLGEKV